jgi:hypothetical protein
MRHKKPGDYICALPLIFLRKCMIYKNIGAKCQFSIIIQLFIMPELKRFIENQYA